MVSKASKETSAVAIIPKKRSTLQRDNFWGYCLIAPWLLGLVVFQFGPIIYSLYMSFTDYAILNTPSLVGLENYEKMFADASFYQAVKVTLKYVFLSVPMKLAFALVVAMVMNLKLKGIGIYRTIYYIPSIFGTSIAVAILWKSLFLKDGIVNILLADIGITGPAWLGDPNYVLFTLSLLSVWQFGSSMIVFLGGLKQIPISLYEAAQIDGANPFKQFVYITIPGLMPMIWFNVLMQLINAFQTFAAPYAIFSGAGGPLDSALLYATYLYRQGFSYFNMGYASALSWALLVLITVVAGGIYLLKVKFVNYDN